MQTAGCATLAPAPLSALVPQVSAALQHLAELDKLVWKAVLVGQGAASQLVGQGAAPQLVGQGAAPQQQLHHAGQPSLLPTIKSEARLT